MLTIRFDPAFERVAPKGRLVALGQKTPKEIFDRVAELARAVRK